MTQIQNLARPRFSHLSFNSLAQVAGQLAPLVAAAIGLPVVYRHVSGSDFGIFTLAISAIALFSVMDFGIGRATVRFVSRALGRADRAEAESLGLHALLSLGALSLLLGAVVIVFVPQAAVTWMRNAGRVDANLEEVAYILAAAVPFVGPASALRSLLEGQERFPTVAAIQGAMGCLTYVIPLILSIYTPDIRIIVGGAVAARILGLVLYCAATRSFWTRKVSWRNLAATANREFLAFTGWMIVSNIVGNGLAYADRVLLTRFVPLDRLPYYNVPLEFLTRFMILVNAVISVIFPFLSRVSVEGERLDRIHTFGMAALCAFVPPVLLLCGILAPLALQYWLGAGFRLHSTEIVRILLVGLFYLSLNALALALLNARGISRTIGIMQAIEAPLYILALWYFGRRYGLDGLASVWTCRMFVEFVCFTAIQMHETTTALLCLGSAALGVLQSVPLILLAGLQTGSLAAILCLLLTGVAVTWTLSAFQARAGVVG